MIDGGPAFPTLNDDTGQYGMMLRDYFAAKAMQGIIHTGFSEAESYSSLRTHELMTGTATLAFQLADAMLKAREEKPA